MTDDTLRKTLSYRWIVFLVMSLTYILAFFHRVSPAVVALDLQEAFVISGGVVGLLSSMYFYSYALVQFPAGLLSDSLGPRKSVTLFLLISAGGSVLFGAASNWETCMLGRVLVGLGAGMAFTPTMKILAHWFTVKEFPKMTGVFLSLGGVGALTAAAPLAFMASSVGWRLSFEIIGGASVLLAVAVWLTVRDKPEDLGWAPISEIDMPNGEAQAAPNKISLLHGAKKVFITWHFWPVAMWGFLTLGVFFGFAGLWAGPYLIQVYDMSREQAGWALNMPAVGIIVGSLFMSFLSDKVFRSRRRVLTCASAVLTVILIILNLYPVGLSYAALCAIMFLFGVCALAPGVIGVTTSKELFPLEMAGTAIGAVNAFPFIGGAIIQMVIGWLLEMYPQTESGGYSIEAYAAMFKLLLVLAVVAFIGSLLMKETHPRFFQAPEGSSQLP